MKMNKAILLAAAVLCAPAIAMAQGGCVNSPENPTLVLALVGGAACCFNGVRARLSSRRSK